LPPVAVALWHGSAKAKGAGGGGGREGNTNKTSLVLAAGPYHDPDLRAALGGVLRFARGTGRGVGVSQGVGGGGSRHPTGGLTLCTRSDPARSTRCSLDRRTVSLPTNLDSMDTVKMQCDRDDARFMGVAEMARLVSPWACAG
jgi:hypothetical protein